LLHLPDNAFREFTLSALPEGSENQAAIARLTSPDERFVFDPHQFGACFEPILPTNDRPAYHVVPLHFVPLREAAQDVIGTLFLRELLSPEAFASRPLQR